VNIKQNKIAMYKAFHVLSVVQYIIGLQLRAGGRGYPLATMNVVPYYFQGKIEENYNPKKSLAV